jgi:cytochrome b subunit of formate dehydrogenase
MKIKRQSLSNRIIHWLIALDIFALIFSGIGQMPVYKRYMISDLPLLGWTSNYSITLWLHSIFGAALVAFAAYHIAVHIGRGEFDIIPKRGDFKASLLVVWATLRGKEEPPSEKYLPEQRLAYAFIAFSIALLIVTGLIKMAKNIAGWNIPDALHFWVAQLHNLGFILIVLGIIGHLAAFLLKPNRALLSAMFSGNASADYALRRHKLWKEGVKQAQEAKSKEERSE